MSKPSCVVTYLTCHFQTVIASRVGADNHAGSFHLSRKKEANHTQSLYFKVKIIC